MRLSVHSVPLAVIQNNMEIVKKTINDSHYYFVDGIFYPSVTHILDVAGPKEYGLLNFLRNNTAEESERIKNQTAARGSVVHSYIERLLNGLEVNISKEPSDVQERVCRFAEWFLVYKPTNFASEQIVASVKMRYAGTLDMICTLMIDGKPTRCLIDFKNTSGIRFSHKLQLMAYKQAYEELNPSDKIQECYVLRLGTQHKAGYEFKKVEIVDIKHFNAVYELYLAMNDGVIPDPPIENSYPETLSLLEIIKK